MTFDRIGSIFYFAQPTLTNDSIEIFFKIKAREDSEVGQVEYGNTREQILRDY